MTTKTATSVYDVTHIELEPVWKDGDHLLSLNLAVVNEHGDRFSVVAHPVYKCKIDLHFPDPPEGLDGLASRGFEEVTEPVTALMYARDSFIKQQVIALEDFMREQADILDTADEGLPFDFDEELGEVMDALRDAIAIDLNLALNQTELEL